MEKNEFLEKSIQIWGDKYDYSKTHYTSMNKHIIIIYNGREYKQMPSKHLMGRKCEVISVKTTEQFVKEAISIWGDKYDYSRVQYVRGNIPVDIVYNNKIYSQKPTQHLLGYRPERDTIKNGNDFIRKARERWGDKYDYSLSEYKNSQEKIKIIFNGVIYEQKASAHIWSKGCVEKVNTKLDKSEFISISEDIHSFKYNYECVNYKDKNTKVSIICLQHGEFIQSPSRHLSGYGCPKCQETIGRKKIKKFLDRYKIKYVINKKFKNCINDNNVKLPFDFYIPSMNICIEFSGVQHYKPIFGDKAYENQKKNDAYKNSYCETEFINYLKIKYDQYFEIWDVLWLNIGVFIRQNKLG